MMNPGSGKTVDHAMSPCTAGVKGVYTLFGHDAPKHPSYQQVGLDCLNFARTPSDSRIIQPKGDHSLLDDSPVISHVTTAEEQARLTPEEVLQQFKDGNKRFRTGKVTRRNHREQVRKSAPGQFPKAMVLSCLDSRVPVEDVFDQGIGDVFVGRVAGNFVNEDLLGSMEFACKVAGAKMILVMGHQHCGAIRGAIDDVKLGHLTTLLAKIKPAVALSQDFEGDKTSANPLFVQRVAENNVRLSLLKIRKESPILKEMEDDGQIKIVGAFYRLTDGTLEFIE